MTFLVIGNLISWVRFYGPGFSTVKLLSFSIPCAILCKSPYFTHLQNRRMWIIEFFFYCFQFLCLTHLPLISMPKCWSHSQIDASMLPKTIHLCQLYAGSHPKCQALQDEIRTWNITVSFIQYTWIEWFHWAISGGERKAEIIPDLQELFLIRWGLW